MQELIEISTKNHPDAELFWYTEEINSIMAKHGMETFNYYNVPNAFLTELGNFIIDEIKWQTHVSNGHTTHEYRESVKQSVDNLHEMFESPDYEEYLKEVEFQLQELSKKYGIDTKIFLFQIQFIWRTNVIARKYCSV